MHVADRVRPALSGTRRVEDSGHNRREPKACTWPTGFDQDFPQGYPQRIGERIRELRWGEHVSLIRDWNRAVIW